MQRCGFIGLGHLGVHLASSLVRAGFDVTVHDLERVVAEPLLDAGAMWAGSPAEVAATVEVVFTCLPTPGAVTTVVAGEGGILEGSTAGLVWVDMSTNDIHELHKLAALVARSGVVCLEAPVTGGVHKAASGEITVVVGGDEDTYQRLLPQFRAMGDQVFHMGPLGSASIIKVITNMLAFTHLVATGEALMLARRGGLDLTRSFEVIKASSGNSFVHETESQVIFSGSYNIGFTMDLACKDLGFARQLGAELGVPLELADLVEQTFLRARSQYGGSAWSSQVVKLLEDALGTDLRAPGFPEMLT